jgi:uncharacterized protein
MPSALPEPTWYGEGLRFACTRCGNCCTGAPGSVRVSEDEAVELARFVGLDLADFHERCTRLLPDGATGLLERANLDCIFWSRTEGCLVYAVRPRQCRTWPFWRANLASPAHWQAAAQGCPGIGQGPLHAREEIARQAADDGTSGVVPAPG